MEIKKINTVPRGTGAIIMNIVVIFLALLCTFFLYPKSECWGCLCVACILLIMVIHLLHIKYWNFIYFAKDKVVHKNTSYLWENVFVTIKCNPPGFYKSYFFYYIYFNDHYLTEKECNSKTIKKEGFYIIFTSKRVNLLLSLYPKKVKIISEIPTPYHRLYRRDVKILNRIKEHNLRCDNESQ